MQKDDITRRPRIEGKACERTPNMLRTSGSTLDTESLDVAFML